MRDRDTIPYSQEIFEMHVPIDSCTHYPAFTQSGCTVKPLPKRMRTVQGGSLYHFYDSLWYDLCQEGNFDFNYLSVS